MDKEQLRQLLLAMTSLGSFLTRVTATKVDDDIIAALGKLAMNDGALSFIFDVVEIFKKDLPEAEIQRQLSKVAEKHSKNAPYMEKP
jgi:hypothetical protein